MFRGSPSTMPVAARSAAMAAMAATSVVNRCFFRTVSGEAIRRDGSETATPIVRVPRSRPTSAPAGQASAKAAASS
jgi:hypothetical protein